MPAPATASAAVRSSELFLTAFVIVPPIDDAYVRFVRIADSCTAANCVSQNAEGMRVWQKRHAAKLPGFR
jgi:hypothetical protein